MVARMMTTMLLMVIDVMGHESGNIVHMVDLDVARTPELGRYVRGLVIPS